ncbi:ceroid-lipofuscinosis neuronal protein 6 homolog isoform X2 [Scophthalmus maximus]|uniref:ceroid-lipofuscinosis neuronal protein 6 homolog isoform X2 n=1 Tax=Scophthalmus maximus TaxID=52904 RepID=UPI001FA92C3E|nr:ceroid-lipofuscinosis neuronal protein 6 homolog isoform X2 [Scophthalmus maximus]
MQPSGRRRPSSALRAAALTCGRSPGSTETETLLPKPRFHLDLWLSFTIQTWVLDLGRPVVMLVFPSDSFPQNFPGAAVYLQVLFNLTSPLILIKVTSTSTRHIEHVTVETFLRPRHHQNVCSPVAMLERCPGTPPLPAVHLGIVAVVMGTSLHLVADSVTRRLLLIGYQLHLSVRDNPVLQEVRPSSLVGYWISHQTMMSSQCDGCCFVSQVDVCELLFHYDDTVGHVMWSVPLFLVLLFFFSGSYCHRTQEEALPPAAWMLLAPNTAYYWYMITEGQTFILFIFTCFAMAATVMCQRRRGMVPDCNGLFMLYGP